MGRDHVKVPIENVRELLCWQDDTTDRYRSLGELRRLFDEAEADDRVELCLTKPQLAALWYIIRSSLDGSLWVDKLDPHRKVAHDSAGDGLICDTCHQVIGIVRRGYADAGKPKICEDKPLPAIHMLKQVKGSPPVFFPRPSLGHSNAIDIGEYVFAVDDIIALGKALEERTVGK